MRKAECDFLWFTALAVGAATTWGTAGGCNLVCSVSWNSRSSMTTSSNSCPMGADCPSSSQDVVTQCRPLSSVNWKWVRSCFGRGRSRSLTPTTLTKTRPRSSPSSGSPSTPCSATESSPPATADSWPGRGGAGPSEVRVRRPDAVRMLFLRGLPFQGSFVQAGLRSALVLRETGLAAASLVASVGVGGFSSLNWRLLATTTFVFSRIKYPFCSWIMSLARLCL